jgi:hypothetical protein
MLTLTHKENELQMGLYESNTNNNNCLCCDGWRFASMPKHCKVALQEKNDLSASSIRNHSLLQTTEETNTNAKLRCLTDTQKTCAELLFASLWQYS